MAAADRLIASGGVVAGLGGTFASAYLVYSLESTTSFWQWPGILATCTTLIGLATVVGGLVLPKATPAARPQRQSGGTAPSTSKLAAIFNWEAAMNAPRLPQEQRGGAGSTNIQAGQDVHVHGLSVNEARQVALDVFRANALELQGVAQAAATKRAEELTNAYFEKIQTETPEAAAKLADPDVQNAFFEAQREYARSGEEDLRTALVDLLAARSKEQERNLRTLALNEAITSAAKLTEQQRRAIAWIFYLRCTRDIGAETADIYYERVAQVVEALGVEIPTRHADYQHIEYVGAGSISMGSRAFASCLYSGDEGLFTNGFEESAVAPDLWAKLSSKSLLIPALRDSTKVQLPVRSDQDLPDLLAAHGLSVDLDAAKSLVGLGRLSDQEILDEAQAKIPGIKPLQATWDSDEGSIKMMTLTSVGIALGHAYWSRLTGRTSALSIWL